jgi:cytochrome P450
MRPVGVREVHALFRERGEAAWLDMALRYGKTFRYQGVVITCDTRLVEPLLRDRPHTERRSIAHRYVQRVTPGSDGLLFLEGERWETQHRAVAPTFTRAHVQQFAGFIHTSTVGWAESWVKAGQGADLQLAINQLGLTLVLRAGYGLDPADPLARAFGQHLLGYKLRTMRADPRGRLDVFGHLPTKLLDLPWLARTGIDLHRRVAGLRRLAPHLVEHARCPVASPGWIGGLAAQHLPPFELTDALNHLYGAYNAVDFVIAAAVYELSRHSDWRARMRAELDDVLVDRPFPTMNDVGHLPVSWSVIREVLRCYPVAMCIFRQTGAPLAIDGVSIPTGSQVGMLPYALHHHPDYWASPEVFDPGRWLGSDRPHSPFAYIPFLVGPRKCLGQPLAELELLVVLSALVRSFDVDITRPDPVGLTPFLIPRFAADLPFVVQRVDQRAHQPVA